MNIDYVMLFNAFMYCLSVGASMYFYTKDTKKSFTYFIVVFAVHLPIFSDKGRYDYGLLYTAMTMFLLMMLDRKKLVDAVYETTGTVAKTLLSSLIFIDIIVPFFINWVGSASFNITIAVLQFLGVIIISHFEFKITHFKLTKTSKIFSVVIFTMIILFYGAVMPNISDKPFHIYNPVYGFFINGMVLVLYFGSMIITKVEVKKEKTENELERQTDLYENMNEIWDDALKANHSLKGLFSTVVVYIENKDFEGLRTYFYEQLEPELNREPEKVINLENIQVELIRNQIYFEYKQAKAKNITMDIDISGRIKDFGIDKYALQKVLSIYFDNAVEASQYVENPYISLNIERLNNCVSIELANRFNPNAKKQTKSENRGHGLRFADEYLSKCEKIKERRRYYEGDTFIQKIIIGVDDWYDDTG